MLERLQDLPSGIDGVKAVGRVALASDSRLADLAPRLAEHLAQAEIRRFGYDALEEAVAWAEGAGVEVPVANR
jgi:hypothetical protein